MMPQKSKLEFPLLFLTFNLFLFSALISDYLDNKIVIGSFVEAYNLMPFQVSYHYEFLKRGLVGTVFYLLSIPINELTVTIFSVLVINTLFILFYLLTTHIIFDAKTRLLFLVAFLASPATALQFGNDFGRYDPLLIVLFLTTLHIILFSSKKVILIFGTSLISMTGMLVHEIYLFIAFPIIVFSSLLFLHNDLSRKIIFTNLISVSVVLVFLLFYGKANYLSTIQALSVYSGLPAEGFPINIWSSGILENIEHTLARYEIDKTWKKISHDVIIIIPYFLMVWLIVKSLKLELKYLLLLSTPVAIFPLFLLGIDFSRWFGLIVVNLMILFLLFYKLVYLQNNNLKMPKFIWGVLILLGFTGPLGIT